MTTMDKNMATLLKGGCLLKEVPSFNEHERTWLEISAIQDKPAPYPLRTPPHAMLKGSPYLPTQNIESTTFRLRKSSFSAEDIAMEYDPSYDNVGKYQTYNCLHDLFAALEAEKVHFEDFTEAKFDDDYPL